MKQKYTILVLVSLLFIISIPLVHAQNITFSLDQSEYYFKVGDDAVINLKSNSDYNDTINGILSYTITQTVNQGNLQYSSSNTKSTSFSVESGEKIIAINFGTSDSPITLTINLKFSYNDPDSKFINLNNIKIHFVNNDSKKNNQQNQVSSSSQTQSQSAQQQNQQNDPFTQQMQQMMNQMNQGQQTQQQTAEQKLQNNQLSQDSSALKQQMQNQIQKQQQTKNEFQKQLAQNPDFQKEHQNLLNKGYNLTDANLNPTNSNTGDFELNYQKPNGEQASISGQMNNGTIQNMQSDTSENRQKMLDELEKNKQFQEYQKQLEKQGYQKQNNTDFSHEQNKTNIQFNYQNKNNETAKINVAIQNDTIKNISMIKKEDENKKRSYLWVIIILILLILAYFGYKKFFKKTKSEQIMAKRTRVDKPFDYMKESLKLLEKSKKEFIKKEYKNAYGTAGQALRLYLSYENHLNKEITNDEILNHLRNNHKEYKDIKKCFDLCSLVEFAKYKANKKDFDDIVNHCEKIIEKPVDRQKKTQRKNR